MIPRTNLVEIHRKAGEILFWARDRVSCRVNCRVWSKGSTFVSADDYPVDSCFHGTGCCPTLSWIRHMPRHSNTVR